MPTIKNTFHLQAMDKETDSAFVKNGMTRHTQNVRFGTNGGNDGVGVNIKGTLLINDYTDNLEDFKCIGGKYDENTNKIFYFLATSDGLKSKIIEYRVNEGVGEVILNDDRGVLNFNKYNYITGINEIDGLLYWTEWGRNPRRINIERAKGYGLINGFKEEDIMVAVMPPLNKLSLILEKTDNEENYIEEKMLYFSYQYRYLDGEYSSLAPFTNAAFMPENFNYDFSEQSNRSMVNKFNAVRLQFNTGNERVTEIRLVFKESQSNSEWIIDDFNKELMEWGHNETKDFLFTNNKRFKALSDNVLNNYFNNVPITVKSQTVIDGRLLYGHYKDGFDIVDEYEEKIELDYFLNLISIDNKIENPNATHFNKNWDLFHLPDPFNGRLTLDNSQSLNFSNWFDIPLNIGTKVQIVGGNSGYYIVISKTNNLLGLQRTQEPYPYNSGLYATSLIWILDEFIPSLIPRRTIKSLIDYEVGIIYADDWGRSTIVLTSKTNTINIPIVNSVTENKIQVELMNRPPAFATNYRFFIKPSKKEYDYILPTLFYEDGVYRWIKIERSDIDKIKEGDYLTVKSDLKGVKNRIIKTKILEIKQQSKNFLQPDNQADNISEIPGTYFKIMPKGFSLNKSDLYNHYIKISDTSANNTITISAQSDAQPHFYGDGVNDCSISGVYNGGMNERNRYTIKIDGESPDTFSWRDSDSSAWNQEYVPINQGIPYPLNHGLSVTFDNSTGHFIDDEWTFNARGAIDHDGFSKAWGYFMVAGGVNEQTVTDEDIQIGANITLIYDEWKNETHFWEINTVSNGKYDNIQEWYYKENIFDKINAQNGGVSKLDIHFFKGYLEDISQGILPVGDGNGYTIMMVKSRATQNNDAEKQARVRSTTNVSQIQGSENSVPLILETQPEDAPPEMFYEIGRTYPIINGYHKAYILSPDAPVFSPEDQDQTETQPLKLILDWFNAFSYGNGVESYKIKDEFNRKGLETGIRVLTTQKEEYKQVTREADITWSDIYEEEGSFNGLSTFNLSLINFIKLDKEEGSIQLLHNANGNLMVFQEDAIGLMPYNKNVIYDAQGGKVVGVSTNVLDRKSYSPYAQGNYGTRHPESFVSRGSRKYIIDQVRGKLLRIAENGVTPISDNHFDNYFSKLMSGKRNVNMVAGYDPKHGEYIFYVPDTFQSQQDDYNTYSGVYSFKEKALGFPLLYTYNPDFILEANNECYAWKNGKMYRLNATENRNNFFGQQYNSLIKFFANTEFSIEKIWKAIGIEGTHPWKTNVKTKLTSRDIPIESFKQLEDYWYSDIKGNTNGSGKASSSFGMGVFSIVNGRINTPNNFTSLSVGDTIKSATIPSFNATVLNITSTQIILDNNESHPPSFLIYSKNQNIDGSSIRGDVLEITMENFEQSKVEIRAVNTIVTKSNIS